MKSAKWRLRGADFRDNVKLEFFDRMNRINWILIKRIVKSNTNNLFYPVHPVKIFLKFNVVEFFMMEQENPLEFRNLR